MFKHSTQGTTEHLDGVQAIQAIRALIEGH